MGVIPKKTIEKFLTKPRKDYRTFKKLTEGQLEGMVDELPVHPPIWSKLKLHQKISFMASLDADGRFCLWLDTGCGKTLTALALSRYYQRLGKIKSTLFLVPRRANKGECYDEIRKHSKQTRITVLRGSSANKWEQLKEPADVVIETYGGFSRMLCVLKPHKKKDKDRLVPSGKLVRRAQTLFQGLVMDESIFVANKRALPFRLCRQMGKAAKLVLALNGTPFGDDPIDMWAQMFLVDGGETLGPTLGLLRAAFCKAKDDYWGHTTYTFDNSKKALLHRIVANRSVRYVASQADLPKLVPIIKYVSLAKDANDYYEIARETIRKAKGNYLEMKNAFIKARQLSSGWLGYSDDDAGIRAQFEFKPNPKLELLLSIIETIPRNHKIIIFNEYVFSGSIICRELEKVGVGHVRLYGMTKDTDRVKFRHQFDHDPKVQVLVLQNAIAFGLNLQAAKYGIFFESPTSPIYRKQARRRFERQYSSHDVVFMYDLVVRKTVDQGILDAHRRGVNLFDAIVDGEATL